MQKYLLLLPQEPFNRWLISVETSLGDLNVNVGGMHEEMAGIHTMIAGMQQTMEPLTREITRLPNPQPLDQGNANNQQKVQDNWRQPMQPQRRRETHHQTNPRIQEPARNPPRGQAQGFQPGDSYQNHPQVIINSKTDPSLKICWVMIQILQAKMISHNFIKFIF